MLLKRSDEKRTGTPAVELDVAIGGVSRSEIIGRFRCRYRVLGRCCPIHRRVGGAGSAKGSDCAGVLVGSGSN